MTAHQIRGKYNKISMENKKTIVKMFDENPEDLPKFLQMLNIKQSTARSIIRKYFVDGKITPAEHHGKKASVCTPEMKNVLISLIDANCSVTLNQMRSTLQTKFPGHQIPSISTIERVLQGLLYTTKKVSICPCARNSETTINSRKEYADWLIRVSGQFTNVYIDESGFNLWERRSFGRSHCGEPAILTVDSQRNTNLSLVLAVSSATGYVYHEFNTMSTNAASFLSFIKNLVAKLREIHTSRPFCLIMDNCNIHKSKEVKEFLDSEKIMYHFLPPWSPFLNPIEEVFALIKCHVRQDIANMDWHSDLIKNGANLSHITQREYRFRLLSTYINDAIQTCLNYDIVSSYEMHSMSYLTRCSNREVILH